tara:strand:+ start:10169 stop:11926 length:1758 start_codon:yes stop_codon:yes gene_type:complete
MKSDFLIALTQLAAERNLPREMVLSAIEAALVSAYKKDGIMAGQDISVQLDPGSGEVTAYILKQVVENVDDPKSEILLKDAIKIRSSAAVGDSVPTDTLPNSSGRIAAQTAKQVVMQRLREAERDLVYDEFSKKEGDIFTVTVQRIEARQITVEIGRAEGIMPIEEQASTERFRVGQKIRVILKSIERSIRGPEVIVSRTDSRLVERLFENEVPEIYNGAVDIVSISREPGSRSKVAVQSKQEGIDPVGSCVGLRGVRIQSVVNELMGEKIDVVEWNSNPSEFISNALSPSQVMRVELDVDSQTAVAIVPERHLSLAIGKEGQNARLAAKLTGWGVDIRSNVEADARREVEDAIAAAAAAIGDPDEAELELLGLPPRILKVLVSSGISKIGELLSMTEDEFSKIKGFGDKSSAIVKNRIDELGLMAVKDTSSTVLDTSAEPEEITIEDEETQLGVEDESLQEVGSSSASELIEEVEQVDAGLEQAHDETSIPAEDVAIDEFEKPVELEEALPIVAEEATSIRDVPEDVWAIHRSKIPAGGSGQIRFAEDIADLKGGITARRGKSRDGGNDRSKNRKVRVNNKRRK